MLDDPSGASDWLNIFRRNRIEGWQDVSYDQNTVIEEVRKERRRNCVLKGTGGLICGGMLCVGKLLYGKQ